MSDRGTGRTILLSWWGCPRLERPRIHKGCVVCTVQWPLRRSTSSTSAAPVEVSARLCMFGAQTSETRVSTLSFSALLGEFRVGFVPRELPHIWRRGPPFRRSLLALFLPAIIAVLYLSLYLGFTSFKPWSLEFSQFRGIRVQTLDP